MVNVRFKNYKDFVNFFLKAPRNVQRILYKAYPDFAARMTNDYINSTKKITSNPQPKPQPQTTPKQIGMAKDTVKGIKDKVEDTIKNTAKKATEKAPVLSKVGKIAKWGGRALAGAGTAWTMLDPKTTWNQKILGAGLSVPHPVVRAASLAGLGATELIPQAVQSYYDKKMAGDNRYNWKQGDEINMYDTFDTLNTNFTPEQRAKVDAYNKAIRAKLIKEADDTLAANQALQDEYQQGIDRMQEAENGLTNVINGGSYPEPPKFNYTTGRYTNQTSQNAPEGAFIYPQDTQVVNQNQQALTSNVDVPNIFSDIPDYGRWNAGVSSRLADLQAMNNNQVEGVQPMQNNAGTEALLQYLQLQNAKNQQAQQANEAILKQYQDAVRADERQAYANQLGNFITSLTPSQRGGISYVSARGDLNTIPVDQYSQSTMFKLPSTSTGNVDKLAAQLKLQQGLKGNVKDDITGQVLTAQALGDMYNVNPLIFLNSDLAKEYMQGQNTLANTRVTGQERRMDIPMNTQADVIKQDAITAGKLATDKANAYYDYVLELMRQSGMNERQAQQIASQEAMGMFAQENQNYRAMLEDTRIRDLAPFNRETQLMVADAYARNRGTQEESPLSNMYKAAQIQQIGASFQNPQQQQMFWDYVNKWGDGTSAVGGVNPYGISIDQEKILRRQRNR